MEAGAGAEAGYPDADYAAQGAQVAARLAARSSRAADIIVQVLCYGSNDRTGQDDLPLLRRDQVLIGFLRPLGSIETDPRRSPSRGVTSFSVELMPRTTRAQSMDALSSMATICGYKAVVLAADTLPRLFPMLTTAAGTITPGAGAGDRRGRGRAPGDRHRAAAGRRRLGLRPAAGRQGAGPEPRGPVRRAADRGQGRRGRPRLRAGAGRVVLPAPARAARAGRGRERRRHHGRRDPGQEVAGAGDRRDGGKRWPRAR